MKIRLLSPLNWWWERKWRHSGGLTAEEVAVVKAILPPDDGRSALLIRQALDAPEVRRQRCGTLGYDALIPYVKDSRNLIELDQDTSSPVVAVRALSGHMLRFSVFLARGGFLSRLQVVVDRDDWPLNWAVSPAMLADARVRHNWLPSLAPKEEVIARLGVLAEWAGLSPELLTHQWLDVLVIHPPASPDDLATAELRLGCGLPTQYRELVSICDGFSLRVGRPYELLGARDLCRTDIPGVAAEQVMITNLYEDGLVLLSCSGSDAGTTFFVGPGSRTPERIGELRSYVRDSLAWQTTG